MSIKNSSRWLYPVVGFVIFILLGSLFLMVLPLKEPFHNFRHLSFIDALFMATSAACVTGLSVLDIGSLFTIYGQIVILGLIQIRGLAL